MLELLGALGRETAIWVGHDWGSPVVWSLASHHPERCLGVASLCVPYIATGFAPKTTAPLVDRKVYPEADYPVGQWDYMLFYEQNSDRARAGLEADIPAPGRGMSRAGDPAGRGKPARTAAIRRAGGWFGAAGKAPDLPIDTRVVTEEDASKYT